LNLSPLYGGLTSGTGVTLKARIDDGPVLRMLLDSGAQNVVIEKRVASRLKLGSKSDMKLVGLGASLGNASRVAPGRLEIGGLVLENCPMVVSGVPMREGTDGVLPLSLFEAFLVRLDLPRKTLDLQPYAAQSTLDATDSTAVRSDQRMLFLQATVNQAADGYLLVDTGSVYNGISPAAARACRNYRMLAPSISLTSGGGETDGFLLPPGVRFRVGPSVMNADPAVVVDLSAISRLHRFEVSGVIGYPAIRDSIVTIDYRDARVRIEKK
jgi:hypothetical protein